MTIHFVPEPLYDLTDTVLSYPLHSIVIHLLVLNLVDSTKLPFRTIKFRTRPLMDFSNGLSTGDSLRR